jgi:diacylglycerol O-acyltransferase
LDAAFAALDDEHSALNIASIAVFAGPALSFRDFSTLFRRKLHLVPRLRQVLQPVPLGLARPAWIDDTSFDLRRHLRRTDVAPSAGMSDLEHIVSDFVSTPLDRDRPLWQALLVDGLSGGRWAIVTKVHHSVVDGVAGLALVAHLLDSAPDAPLPAPANWHADSATSRVALVRSALRVQAHATRTALAHAGRLALRPGRALADVRATVRGVDALRAGLHRTAPSSLSGALGTSRSYVTGQLAMADVDAVRGALGGTVNDVALALVTAAHRRVMLDRGEQPRPHQVHCLVPVSLHPHGPADPAGNLVSALIIDLPVEFADPRARYEAVLARTKHAKQTHEAVVGADLQIALDALPPPLVSAAVRAAARMPQHFLTTVLTNVPGSTRRLYARGRPLLEHYPYVPIADRVRTGIALTSYNEQLFVGITADRDSTPDVATIRDAMRLELLTLTELADTRRAHE